VLRILGVFYVSHQERGEVLVVVGKIVRKMPVDPDDAEDIKI
jgi:hypothetical protein